MKINWKISFWIGVFFVIGFIGIAIWNVVEKKVGFTDLFLPITSAVIFSGWAYLIYKRRED